MVIRPILYFTALFNYIVSFEDLFDRAEHTLRSHPFSTHPLVAFCDWLWVRLQKTYASFLPTFKRNEVSIICRYIIIELADDTHVTIILIRKNYIYRIKQNVSVRHTQTIIKYELSKVKKVGTGKKEKKPLK